MRRMNRAGLTAVELAIAIGVFAALMVTLLQSLTGVVGYVSQEQGLGDTEIAGRLATNQITNDMANTAWFYAYDSTLHQFNTNVQPLYPAITQGTVSADGSEKDVLEFVKIRTSGTVASSPYSERYNVVQYKTTAAPTVVTLDQYASSSTFTATSTPFLILNPNYPQAPSSNDVYVSHVWEYFVNDATTSNNFDQNQDSTRVRHYHYSVINVDSYTNTGQLVRTYYNGNGSTIPTETNGSWNSSDRVVLLEHVKSFVVRNYYSTGTSLNSNQISFSITVAKPQDGNNSITLTRTFKFISAMRSITRQ